MLEYHIYVNRERRKGFHDGTWGLFLPEIFDAYRPHGAADYSNLTREKYGHVVSIRAVLVQWEDGDFKVYDDTTYDQQEMQTICKSRKWKHQALYNVMGQLRWLIKEQGALAEQIEWQCWQRDKLAKEIEQKRERQDKLVKEIEQKRERQDELVKEILE